MAGPRGLEVGGERAARGAYDASRAAALARGRRAAGAFTGAAAGAIARVARAAVRGGGPAASVSLALMPATGEGVIRLGASFTHAARGAPAPDGAGAQGAAEAS